MADSFVRGLKCRMCGKSYPKEPINFCEDDFGPLEVDYDYEAIAKEARGRRVFPANPDASLFLMKAAGKVPHGGGKRLPSESADYQVVRRWVACLNAADKDALAAIAQAPPDAGTGRQASASA